MISNKIQADLIVKHATILTMDASHQVIPDGAIVIIKDTIAAIGKTDSIMAAYQATEYLEAEDCLVIPGLINAHSHIPMSYFKGLADDLPLEKWLQGYIWPLESRLLNPDFVYDASLHGAAEMIKSGITLTSDMYFYGNDIARALTKAGLRGILGEAIVDFKLSEQGGMESIGKFAVEQNYIYRDNPLIDFALSPHSIYACSSTTLTRVLEQALENNLLIHTHLSETEHEVQDCLAQHRKRPVEYLHSLGMLKSRLVLAHGIWVNEDEMHLLADNDVSVAICTESNLKLASGIAPLFDYQQNKVRCCFGTDGVASNNNLDLLSELDFTAKLHKAVNHDPTFLPAEHILHMATVDAAKALQRFDELGSLETGKKADLVILDCHTIEAQPLFNPYSQVVYALGGKAVRDVVIKGDIVLKNKQLVRLDETELINTTKRYKNIILGELNK